MESTEVQEQFAITTPAHWKALSHPLRLGILERLAAQAMTNEELARSLGVASGKLYFHTKQLLDAGMIRLVETRPKGPILQKLYRAVARHYVAMPTDDKTAPPLAEGVAAGLEFYRQAWQDNPDLTQLGYKFAVRVPRETARVLFQRVQDLVAEARAGASDSPDAVPLAFTLLLHSFSVPANPGEENKNAAPEPKEG